jgi:Ca2+-binding EF-hand superfamily protein
MTACTKGIVLKCCQNVKHQHPALGEAMSITALSSTVSNSYWEEFFNLSNSQKNRKSEDLSTSLFSDLDTDSDGKVSMQESGLSQQTFDALDTDQDGSVSLEELENALELNRSSMFTRMKLSEDEEQTALSRQNEGTEKPDAKELLAAIMNEVLSQAGNSEAMNTSGQDLSSMLFTELDTDAGGGLNSSETGTSQSVFDAMDINQDGTVSAEELAAALEKQKEATSANSNDTSISGKAKDSLLSLANKAYSAISQNKAMTLIDSTI